jgi:hypothetical protein
MYSIEKEIGKMSNYKNSPNVSVPKALKVWFIIHFVVDVLFAIPLLIIPELFLGLLGWERVDTIAARIVAAALFGIGIESFIGRNSSVEAFKGMLNLKVIWSISAVIGIALSMIQGAQGRPIFGWVLVAIFGSFNVLWIYWRIRIASLQPR